MRSQAAHTAGAAQLFAFLGTFLYQLLSMRSRSTCF